MSDKTKTRPSTRVLEQVTVPVTRGLRGKSDASTGWPRGEVTWHKNEREAGHPGLGSTLPPPISLTAYILTMGYLISFIKIQSNHFLTSSFRLLISYHFFLPSVSFFLSFPPFSPYFSIFFSHSILYSLFVPPPPLLPFSLPSFSPPSLSSLPPSFPLLFHLPSLPLSFLLISPTTPPSLSPYPRTHTSPPPFRPDQTNTWTWPLFRNFMNFNDESENALNSAT